MSGMATYPQGLTTSESAENYPSGVSGHWGLVSWGGTGQPPVSTLHLAPRKLLRVFGANLLHPQGTRIWSNHLFWFHRDSDAGRSQSLVIGMKEGTEAAWHWGNAWLPDQRDPGSPGNCGQQPASLCLSAFLLKPKLKQIFLQRRITHIIAVTSITDALPLSTTSVD